DRAVVLRRHRLGLLQRRLGSRAYSVRMLVDQIAYRPAILPARDRIAHSASVRNRLLEGFDPAVIAAPEERDPGAPQVLQQDLDRLTAGGSQGSPALGPEDDQSLRLRGNRRLRRTEEPEATSIAAGAARDLDRDLPHVLDRAGVHAVRAHAGRLALAAVDAPLGRLERDVAAVRGGAGY